MKRRLYLILLLAVVAITAMAQTVGEAFYIYRNDGQFNAFFRDDVVSMEYSYEDANGDTYDEIVTQVITTTDSVYKIPVAVIDSISFVTPETTYKPDVRTIEDGLLQYVLSSDELTIVLSHQTPTNLLPEIGDKLVTIEQSDVFPYGFAGEVADVRTTAEGDYLVSCEAVKLTDVFSSYYGISSKEDTEGDFVRTWLRKISAQNGITVNSGFHLDLTDQWERALDLNDNGFAVSYRPNFFVEMNSALDVRGMIIIPTHGDNDLYINLQCIGDFHLLEHIAGTGGLSWSRDWGWRDEITNLPRLSWPIPQCPLIRFYIEPGVFLRASSLISMQEEYTQHYRLLFHYEVSANHLETMPNTLRWIPVDATSSVEGSMQGQIAGGGYAEMGFLISDRDFAHLCFRGELGIAAESNVVFRKDEVGTAAETTALYDQLHSSGFNVNWFFGTKLEGRVWPLTVSYDLPLAARETIASLSHVPDFSNVSLKSSAPGALYAEAEVRGSLIHPVRIGFALLDDDGKRVDTYYSQTEYQDKPAKMVHTFSSLKGGMNYTVHPIVELYNMEMLASPSAEAFVKEFPVVITNFKQTGWNHSENAYKYKDKIYSYKYECAVTIELTNSKDVEDWGYVYKDPYGQLATISLKYFESPYTDTRYVYYRNADKDIISLCPYVKYKGEEMVMGEMTDYEVFCFVYTTCPDDNHPHMIDLGLPSGTLWACCNIGAKAPEESGGYFSWGEVRSKTSFSMEGYAHYTGKERVETDVFALLYLPTFANIGSNISNTEYDAATVNWGAPWHIPTQKQIQELLDSTTSIWTTQKGNNGIKFMNSKGDYIFFPASGNYQMLWDGTLGKSLPCSLFGNQEEGWYWSATSLSTNDKYNRIVIKVYNLFFGKSGLGLYQTSCPAIGMCVRPVR